MKTLFLITLTLTSFVTFAQQNVEEEKNLEVGMWVTLSSCAKGKKAFDMMDLYTKTRFKPDTIKVDTLTGEGVFEHFFMSGDYDAKAVPCSYGGKKYKVAALRIMPDKDTKEDKRVMLLYTSNPNSMIWVEFDKAVEKKEISW